MKITRDKQSCSYTQLDYIRGKSLKVGFYTAM